MKSGQDNGYFSDNTLSGTRANQRIIDIPMDMDIVTRQVMTDIPNDSSIEIMKYASPGVDKRSTLDDDLFLRGERVLGIFVDGIAFNSEVDFPVYDLDRIEVLKGPASLLFGQDSPTGGLVNYVTKSPTSVPYAEVFGTYGSFDFFRGQLDASGPIGNTGFRYRLTLEDTDDDRGPRKFEFDKDNLISGTIDVRPSQTSYFRVDWKYYYLDNYRGAIGINPATGQLGTLTMPNGQLFTVPRDFSYGEPWCSTPSAFTYINAKLVNSLTENLQLQTNINFYNYSHNWNRIDPSGVPDANGDLALGYQHLVLDGRDTSGFIDGIYTSRLGFITNKFQFGGVVAGSTVVEDVFGTSLPSINIFHPVYGTAEPASAAAEALLYIRSYEFQAYVEDVLSAFDDKFMFIFGGRYNDYYTETSEGLGHTFSDLYENHTSHRIGVVVKPIPSVSLYYNYSESFIFNAGTIDDPYSPANGQPFKPSIGKNNEVGLKLDSADGHFYGTFAYFDLSLTDERVLVTLPASENYYLAAIQGPGDQNHGAVELSLGTSWQDVIGKIQGLATFYHGNTLSAGLPVNSVADETWSGLLSQDIESGSLKGLRFGAAVYHKSDVWGVGQAPLTPGAYIAPGYVTTSAFISYSPDRHWTVSFRVDNVFNKFFYEGAEDTWWINTDPGRVFRITLDYKM